jgi:hypothetical protein
MVHRSNSARISRCLGVSGLILDAAFVVIVLWIPASKSLTVGTPGGDFPLVMLLVLAAPVVVIVGVICAFVALWSVGWRDSALALLLSGISLLVTTALVGATIVLA